MPKIAIFRYGLVLWLLLASSVLVRAEEVQSRPSSPAVVPTANPAVDSKGAAIDPTENVKALTAAGLKSAEEAKIALEKLVQAKLDAVKDIADLKSQYALATAMAKTEALSSQLNAEIRRLAEIDKLRADAAADLQKRTTESANNLQLTTAQLASDLRTSNALLADNLRALVNTTAANALAQAKQVADEISKHFATIDQALSEGRGKQTVSDPALANLVEEVRKQGQRNDQSNGQSSGVGSTIAYIFAGIAALAALVGIFMAFNKPKGPDPAMIAMVELLRELKARPAA